MAVPRGRAALRAERMADADRLRALADEVARGGWVSAARGVVRREGFGSLFAGIGATYL